MTKTEEYGETIGMKAEEYGSFLMRATQGTKRKMVYNFPLKHGAHGITWNAQQLIKNSYEAKFIPKFSHKRDEADSL